MLGSLGKLAVIVRQQRKLLDRNDGLNGRRARRVGRRRRHLFGVAVGGGARDDAGRLLVTSLLLLLLLLLAAVSHHGRCIELSLLVAQRASKRGSHGREGALSRVAGG